MLSKPDTQIREYTAAARGIVPPAAAAIYPRFPSFSSQTKLSGSYTGMGDAPRSPAFRTLNSLSHGNCVTSTDVCIFSDYADGAKRWKSLWKM